MAVGKDVRHDRGMTVVLCFDGSGASRAAIAAAGSLLRERSAIVVHVREPALEVLPVSAPGVVVRAAAVSDKAERQAADQALGLAREGVSLAEAVGFHAVPVTDTAAGPSGIAAAILRVAGANAASAVVVGGRGHGPLLSALLGSVSDGVVHRASCPVLVVPPGDRNSA